MIVRNRLLSPKWSIIANWHFLAYCEASVVWPRDLHAVEMDLTMCCTLLFGPWSRLEADWSKPFAVTWGRDFPKSFLEFWILHVITPVSNDIWHVNIWWGTNTTSGVMNCGIANCRYLWTHIFTDAAVACFFFGPPVPYGNAKGSTASIGSSCSFAKLPPVTKTVKKTFGARCGCA